MADRSSRSLLHLQANASTARTLSLYTVWKKHADEEAYKASPFFDSVILNRSIIVKHRLRPNERDSVYDGRRSVTKVILPIDPTDLGVGARSFFVRQKGYESFLEELSLTGEGVGSRDDKLLNLLDDLPSLDPFLMRERLKKSDYKPAQCYFDLSEADMTRMFQFVRREVTPLIGISFDSEDRRFAEKTERLASKILANSGDAELDPLRMGLGMEKAEFDEGVFCWKGFIYYKWTLSDLLPRVRPVADEIGSIRPNGPVSDDDRAYIVGVRERLSKAIALSCETVRTTLKVYDEAYADLTQNGHPHSFRDFLRRAPGLFHELGERLGSVHHIVSFWRFRFPAQTRQQIGGEELIELLADFEGSINFEAPAPVRKFSVEMV
ncbi:MAG TPA: hypothetical protein VGI95_21020 [Caulobacteraceae bacterium]